MYLQKITQQNDDASRGFTGEELLNSDRWLHGPNFLHDDEHKWPIQPTFMCSELENQLEIKRTPVVYTTVTNPDYTNTLLNYFSSWFRLKKAVAWYRKFG